MSKTASGASGRPGRRRAAGPGGRIAVLPAQAAMSLAGPVVVLPFQVKEFVDHLADHGMLANERVGVHFH